ncbi:MAG: UbiA family prenyltransferase [Chitinispirillia bacterium]|nr:UbiA family prenyltransferase [Chitinispirillia bacterium]MCL2242304.1 UbiA family prenyltransferase [Chitinispirillia bacterium]
MKKFLLLIIDLLFLTRPIIIVPVWAFCAFGIYSADKGLFTHLWPDQYLLILLYSLAPAAVYIINQMADYEVDKANEGFPLLVRCNIPMKAAGIFAAVCALTSILGLMMMGYGTIAFLALIAIIAGCIYSCKPFSLSGRPFLDFLTNAFEAFLAFAAGWCVSGASGCVRGGELFRDAPELYIRALPYFLLMCSGSISSTLPDIRGDRAHGKITTAVRFGPKTAHCTALGCLLTVIPVSLLISNDYLALICALLVIPVYIPYLFNSKKSIYMELPHKAGGAVVMLAAATILPVLLPAGIAVYFMTWLYFRLRHKVSYPSLKSGGTDV